MYGDLTNRAYNMADDVLWLNRLLWMRISKDFCFGKENRIQVDRYMSSEQPHHQETAISTNVCDRFHIIDIVNYSMTVIMK
jgi:hypothetical protein